MCCVVYHKTSLASSDDGESEEVGLKKKQRAITTGKKMKDQRIRTSRCSYGDGRGSETISMRWSERG